MAREDVAISGGKIEAIGDLTSVDAPSVVDAEGLYLMPGGIDTQVHFREPGLTHKEDLASGSLAAICGGVTSFLEMPNTNPATSTPSALADKVLAATGRCWSNFGFFFGATPGNASQLEEFELLPGTPGVKIFVGSSTGDLLVDKADDLRRVLTHGHKRVAVHSEDEARNVARKALISANPSAHEHPFLRDAESARLSTELLIRLCEETGRPIHILHISTADELPMIAAAKAKGLPITCEVTPQHLWFSAPTCYDQLETKAQMNPPLRDRSHCDALWRALESDLFDVFGSDHAPHTLEEKSLPYPKSPSGMPGVETILPVLLTFASQGRISYEKVVRMFCSRPADLYGIKSKGRIELGFDADIVLFDPHVSFTVDETILHSKCGWSPYHGVKLTGKINAVYLGGRLASRNGEPVGHPSGRCLDFGEQD
jgi:dihydroorotase